MAFLAEKSPPIWFRVTSSNVDPVVTKATGDYLIFGTMAHGSPLYRLDSHVFDQFLFRSRNGYWAFSPSHNNAVKNRGTISSIENTSSLPMGLTFGYHLATTDIDDRPYNDHGLLLSYCSRTAAVAGGTKCYNTFNVTDVSLTRGAAETMAESLRANDKSKRTVQDRGGCDSKDIDSVLHGTKIEILSNDLPSKIIELPEVPQTELDGMSDNSREDIAESKSRLSEFADKPKISKNEFATKIQAKNSVQAELADSKRDRDTLKVDIIAASREKATFQAKIATTDHEKDYLEAELGGADLEKDSSQAKVATADHKKDNLEAKLGDAGSEKDTLQAKLTTADRDTESHRAELATAGREKDNLRAEIIAAGREKESLQAKLLHADQEKDNLEAKLGDAGREKEGLQAKLATSDHEKDNLKTELAVVKAKLSTAGHEKDSLKTELVDAGREKESLQAKLATADHVTENLRAELSDAGREKESLQAKLATADHEKDSLKSELVDAGREKESLQAKLATADRDTEGLRAEISAAGDERSILKAELTNADREKSKLRAKLATADRKPTDMNLQDLFFQPPWQTGTTVGLAIALMILLFALVKMGPRRNENASKEECTRCDKIQKQVFTLKKSIEDATKEFDTLTVRNAEVCEALQESNERVGMADSSAEEMRSMLESIKVGLSFNFNWNSSADERKKEFEASLADHVKMLESLKESNIGSQIDALKDLLHEANIARSLADEKARSEAAERDLSQQEAKIKEQSLSSDIARLQNDHDLLRATAQERLAEAECLAMANAKAGQDLASAQEECHNAQAKARELQTKLDAVREAIMQAHSTVDLRGAEARGNLESTEAMASDLKSQVDQARLEQRQASENAQAKLNKMHEELASANSVAAIAQAELDALREAQRKAQEEAEKKLRSAFGEVSDMKEKCAYFMQALKNEKQAGTDLRISAVKKVREELNTSKERVKELEAELQLSNSGGKYSAGRAEE